MDEIEKKLIFFKQTVEEEAIEQKLKIESETQEEKKIRIEEAKKRLLEESKRRLEEQKAKIEREYKQYTSKEIYLKRKELLLKRDEIIAEIFEGVTEKIKNFMNTHDYYEYLLNCVKDAAKQFDCKELTIFLKNEDMPKGESLICSFPELKLEIKENPSILVGGIIIKKSGTNLITDDSFDHKLKEAKENFISESGLALEDI